MNDEFNVLVIKNMKNTNISDRASVDKTLEILKHLSIISACDIDNSDITFDKKLKTINEIYKYIKENDGKNPLRLCYILIILYDCNYITKDEMNEIETKLNK